MFESAGLKIIDREGLESWVLDKDDALTVLRHSTSHLLALAVLDLYPDVHLGIGPATSDGFYYDFQTEHRFSEDDFGKIEARMEELRSQSLAFEPSVIDKARALLAGYQEIRLLAESEVDSLQYFVEWAAVLTSAWRFWKYKIDMPNAKKPRKYTQMVEIAKNTSAIPRDEFKAAVFS